MRTYEVRGVVAVVVDVPDETPTDISGLGIIWDSVEKRLHIHDEAGQDVTFIPTETRLLETGEQVKHDGQLDEYDEGEVSLEYGRSILLQGEADGEHHVIVYTPKQALSLLAWLKQEEARLIELAKEQAE